METILNLRGVTVQDGEEKACLREVLHVFTEDGGKEEGGRRRAAGLAGSICRLRDVAAHDEEKHECLREVLSLLWKAMSYRGRGEFRGGRGVILRLKDVACSG